MSTFNNTVRITAGIFAASAVILGAFGAHALKDTLLANVSTETWKTAVNYHMWHALALLATLNSRQASKLTPALFTCGILLFSGSLYWLALDGPRWLGPITPLGGLAFIAGWLAFVASQFSNKNNGTDEPSS